MVRWSCYMIAAMLFDIVAIAFSPLLVIFASDRVGPINNNNGTAVEPRLPKCLSWFDTGMDNSLLGDNNHKARHINSSKYWQMLCWIVRNHGYGFRWSVLAAAPVNNKVWLSIDGPTNLDYHTKTFGVLRITRTDGYWQYKCVKPLAGKLVIKRLRINLEFDTGKILVLNMGWLLDDPSQERALFMCSPRLK